MASTSALNEAQKAMIAERLRSAIERVHDSSGLDALQECRSLFRRGVPLHLRAYVAAALLLEGGEGGGRRGRDGRGPRERGSNGRGSDERGKREPAPGGRAQARAEKPRGSAAPARSAAAPEAAVGKARADRPAPESEGREPPKRRERRYEGEGVTLFVSAGRRQRFYARVALDLLFETPGVSEESVGDVRTMDNYSFITVDPAIEELVIAALDGRDFRGRALGVNRARKKGDRQDGERQDGERRDGEEGPGAYEGSANDEASSFDESADPDPSEDDGL
mgnify:CR=1 FL=1